MKETMSKLLEKMKANKTKTAIIVVAAVLIIALVIGATFFIKNKGKEPVSSGGETYNSSSPVISEEAELTEPPQIVEDTGDIDIPDEVPLPEEEVEIDETPVSNPTNSSAKNNESANSDLKKPTTTNKVTVVQMADPETGVSWDGKSPIIYTYPDGTTGTVKKVGATYEQVPGMINTVIDETPVEYDGKCSDCGKKEGDGTNGTCVQWLMGDVDCPNCGAHVAVRTCHTCGK